ncbi:MAG: radical SAM protein [Deltaproteobacteria bacterium]|nr:radical SAM protein [Deltaproteobacteria bacterium]
MPANAESAYLELDGRELDLRVEAALDRLGDCHVCPRHCGIDRLAEETQFCKTGRLAQVSGAEPHLGEEDPLRGTRGSGTLFLQQCNLHCVFCQNWNISQRPGGQPLDAARIAELMLGLQDRGCHNINLVSPTHVAPQLLEAIVAAIHRGLRLPIVYNTHGYEEVSTVQLFDGVVDIYLPDFKLWEPDSARRLLQAEDYPARARAAIAEMHRQVGVLRVDEDGIARRGVLLRHLVMPGKLAETAAIMAWLAEELSPDTYVNLLAQYRPDNDVGQPGKRGEPKHADVNRRPSNTELAEAYRLAQAAGLWRFDERRDLALLLQKLW